MSISAVSHCPACQAVINIHWLTCLVCEAPIPRPDTATPEPPTGTLPVSPIQPGEPVVVQSMTGGTIRGIVGATTVETEAPLKVGRWYWVCAPAGDRWVHESLVSRDGQ